MLKEMNDSNVHQILNSTKTFIVLFYSSEMPNATNVINVFEEFNSQFQGKIDVYSCDLTKQNTATVSSYFSMNILPAMLMMKKNKVYANVAGPTSKLRYTDIVKQGITQIMSESK